MFQFAHADHALLSEFHPSRLSYLSSPAPPSDVTAGHQKTRDIDFNTLQNLEGKVLGKSSSDMVLSFWLGVL